VKIKIMIALVGGLTADMLGGWDIMLKTLVMLVVIDYATGILAAVYRKKLSSLIGYRGIIKKVGIFAIVIVAAMVDRCAGMELIRNITIVFYISNESISILENVGKTGVKYPKKLKQTLEQLKDGDKK
jgi:toxin secretion/phage lysis holin